MGSEVRGRSFYKMERYPARPSPYAIDFTIITPRPHAADRRKSRIQITKDRAGEVGIEIDAEEPPMARIFGGAESDFSRAASAVPSLKTRTWRRGAFYNAAKNGHREGELDCDP